MRKNIHILLAATLLFGATSCEDFLQKDPPSSPSQSVSWRKKSNFESVLAGTYLIVYSGVFSQVMPCLDRLIGNAIVQRSEDTYSWAKTIAQRDLTPNQGGFVTDIYGNCYRDTARAHILMEQLEQYTGSDISADDKKFILVQCRTLRGHFYSWLCQRYKEVPVMTQSLDLSTMCQPKTTRTEMLNRMMTDYDEAINELPDKLYSGSQMSGRFTASAVRALKAKVLLFDTYDNNGKAIPSKMKEVLTLLQSIRGYSLVTCVCDNFISEKQLASPETMFSVHSLRLNLTHSMDLYYGTWAAPGPTRNMVDASECADGKPWGESPLTVRPDEDILYGNNDTLKKAEHTKMLMSRDRHLYESINHSMVANFTSNG